MSRSDNKQFDNYFTLFGLPESYRVVVADLDRQYKKLQAQYHPDRYTDGADSERLQALQQTSLINEAYETLKSPLKRAAYLLKLQGVDPEAHNQADFSEDFLFRQMTLRETLETRAGDGDLAELDVMKTEVVEETDETVARFETQFKEQDYTGARRTYYQLQFLYKLQAEIDAVEEKLLDY